MGNNLSCCQHKKEVELIKLNKAEQEIYEELTSKMIFDRNKNIYT